MEIKKVAQTARIHIDEGQKQKMNVKLEKVYKWLEDIKKVDVSKFEPLYNVHQHESTAVREIESPEFYSPSVVLSNSSCKDGDFIKVPKVVG